MKEEKIQVFIDSVERFFNTVNDLGATIGTPFLVDNANPRYHDYTGQIKISGSIYKGCVYFTAPKVLLRNILLLMRQDAYQEDNLKDLVGEIANIISGNARSEFGNSFIISVPSVVSGAPTTLPKDAMSYVVPIKFNKYSADIVVCLQDA